MQKNQIKYQNAIFYGKIRMLFYEQNTNGNSNNDDDLKSYNTNETLANLCKNVDYDAN